MADVKYAHRLPPCPDYDIAGVENWLEDLAKEGLLLDQDTPFCGFYSFIRTAPQTVRYRMEPAVKQQSFWDGDPGKPREEAIALYSEMGWEYVTRYGDFHIYRSYDPNARELHTDADIQADALNIIKKRQRSALLWDIFFLGIYSVFGILRYPMGLAVALGTPGMVVFYASMLIILLRPVVSLLKLQALRNQILDGRSIHRKVDWRSTALRHRVLQHVPDILFLCVLISAMFTSLTEASQEIKLADYTGDPPFVTIADLNLAGNYERIEFYAPNTIREWSDVLFPVNIDWYEFASIEMPDGRILKGSLDISYHEAVSSALADQLAKELILYADTGKYFTEAKPVDTGSDAVVAYTYQGKYGLNTILIRYGKIVMEAQILVDDNQGNSAKDAWIEQMTQRLVNE